MERRLHDRLAVKLIAEVVNLTRGGESFDGELLDISQAGVCVVLPAPQSPGDLVRVECSEGTLFGQVIHSAPDGEAFRTGIAIFDVLLGGSDLSKLIWQSLGLASSVARRRARSLSRT